MAKKIEAEGEKAKELYEKYECYCRSASADAIHQRKRAAHDLAIFSTPTDCPYCLGASRRGSSRGAQ